MKYVLLLICLLSLLSCISNRDAIRRSTIKFEGRSMGIRNLIEIDGHYPVSSESKYGSHMFFEDGSWVYFFFQSETSEKERQANMSKAIKTWKSKKQIRWSNSWGVYTIQNDTIIVHEYFGKPNFLNPLSLSEIRYKVVDRNTVQRIYSRNNSKVGDRYYKTHSPWRDSTPQRFVPADSLPPSDNWLKEKKWIWHNKSDWKAYMQMIKQKKKQFRKKEVKTYF